MEKMSYKIVFCDLDETLLDSKKNISKKDVETIRRIREKGVLFVPNTGRAPGIVKDIFELFDFDFNHDYAVMGNGAVISEANHFIIEKSFDYETICDIRDYLDKTELGYSLFSNKGLVSFDEKEYQGRINQGRDGVFVDRNKFENIKNLKVYKIMVRELKDENVDYYKKELSNFAQGEESRFPGGRINIELAPKGTTKGQGVKDLCNYLGIETKDALAIGDNGIDISMLESVGFSCAPKNSLEYVKKYVDYVSPRSNDESAVSEILEKYVLNDDHH